MDIWTNFRICLDAARERERRLRQELEQERERAEALRTVLSATIASTRRYGLDRRKFKALVAEAGRETPDDGPAAARHAVLLIEARRVLGIG